MTPRAEPEIRGLYGDLLEGDDGREILRVVQMLDAGLNLERAPASRAPLRLPQPFETIAPRNPWVRRLFLVLSGAMALVAAVLVAVAAAPTSANITDLGKPTNDLPQYLPLGGFRHTGPYLKQGKKPELL